ncbi:hypothetical protein KC349_g7723 [Hortaea werneckii]|nr:hypothetical protein KC349_g7723 [Hortaea werneckii]
MATTTTNYIPAPTDPLTWAKVQQWKLESRGLLLAKVMQLLTTVDGEKGDDMKVLEGRSTAYHMTRPNSRIDDIVKSNMSDERKVTKLVDELQTTIGKVGDIKAGFFKVTATVENAMRILSKQSEDEDKISKKLVATERLLAQAQARGELDDLERAFERGRRPFYKSDFGPFFPRRDLAIKYDKEVKTIKRMPTVEE